MNASSAEDCFFDVCDVSSSPGQELLSTDDRQFPKSLGPFGLAVTDISPEVDFKTNMFTIKTADNPQLEKLKELQLFPLVSKLQSRKSLALCFGWLIGPKKFGFTEIRTV